MKLSDFKTTLDLHSGKALAFILPNGDPVPAHAHVTEMGVVTKRFMDCGGKVRETVFASLQVWVAGDLDHRFPAGKLSGVIAKTDHALGLGDPEVQVECQQGSISLFSVEGFEVSGDTIAFTLANRHTACLAMEACVPESSTEDKGCCTAGSTCCS